MSSINEKYSALKKKVQHALDRSSNQIHIDATTDRDGKRRSGHPAGSCPPNLCGLSYMLDTKTAKRFKKVLSKALDPSIQPGEQEVFAYGAVRMLVKLGVRASDIEIKTLHPFSPDQDDKDVKICDLEDTIERLEEDLAAVTSEAKKLIFQLRSSREELAAAGTETANLKYQLTMVQEELEATKVEVESALQESWGRNSPVKTANFERCDQSADPKTEGTPLNGNFAQPLEYKDCFENTTAEAYVSYSAFRRAIEMAAGANHRYYRSASACALNVSVRKLAAYEVTNLVPISLLEAIASLTPAHFAPSSRKRWSTEAQTRVMDLHNSGIGDLEIARIITAEFSRRTFETGVTTLRRRVARDKKQCQLEARILRRPSNTERFTRESASA